MKEIICTNGMVAKVDDNDFELVSRHTWTAHKSKRDLTFYASTGIYDSETKKWKYVSMHRLVLPHNQPETDHRDGDGLNNQKTNLRPATVMQNRGNRRVENHSTPYKGVSVSKKGNNYRARISNGNGSTWLGYFDCPKEAAKVYDKAALERWGEFARTNQMMGLI